MRSHKKIQWSALLAGISVMATAGFAFAGDKFTSWKAMELSGCYQEGPQGDYEIVHYEASPHCVGGECYFEIYEHQLVLAIHGGSVELWTDELAAEVAVSNMYGFGSLARSALYQMIGHVDESEYCGVTRKTQQDVHITARNYDETQADTMAKEAFTVVSIHGLANDSYAGVDKDVICVGGLNKEMRDDFIYQVNNDPILSDFVTAEDATASGSLCPTKARGIDSDNIVNRSLTNPNGGLQLEITKKVRDALFASDNYYEHALLVEIIQDVMLNESTQAP